MKEELQVVSSSLSQTEKSRTALVSFFGPFESAALQTAGCRLSFVSIVLTGSFEKSRLKLLSVVRLAFCVARTRQRKLRAE